MTTATIDETLPYSKFLTEYFGTNELVVVPLAGDASARKYVRIVKGNESFVLMVWEPFQDESAYPFLNVQAHFKKAGVLVPEVLKISKTEGLVLLEDLGDLTLERKFWEASNQEQIIPFYRDTIDELIKMHFVATKDKQPHYSAFKIEFNTERLLWEMNYAREHLLEKFLGYKFNAAGASVVEKNFTHICERLHNEPKYIAHRDYHSRNVMLKFAKTRIIDFQDARLGPIQYDLVSLLRDSYVDMSDSVATSLLDYYLLKRLDSGEKPISRDHFNLIYELQSIQRCLKACGSFASFHNTRQDRRYLKYIRPTVLKVQKALAVFPEYQGLWAVLSDMGLFEKDLPIK